EVVCTQHEQAAAIAAETYTKLSGRLALCLVTTGPGGTNAVTGVAGGWLDSTPMVVVSGQVKTADLARGWGVRQRGVQELDIVSIVRPITKDAVMVDDPSTIRYHVERAVHLATSGRPGPVWLDIPLDVQAAEVDPSALVGFTAPAEPSSDELVATAREVADMLRSARRPLALLGAGVRLAGAEDVALRLVERLGLPVLTTWPAHGIVGDDHPLFVGRPGPLAARGANFALQCADVLVCIGARLDMVTTGYDPADFGRRARKVVVDIDPAELAKLHGAADIRLLADAKDFLAALDAALDRPLDGALDGPLDGRRADAARGAAPLAISEWRGRCAEWRARYPVVRPEHRRPGDRVSTYGFADALSDAILDDDVLALGSSGLGIEILLLALRLHTGQRATLTTALGAMGFGPPAAVGACLASGGRRTICVDGDGGLQLNAQELETIRRLDLPVKLFVLSNGGYASIRASQQRWFGRLSGADASSGLTLPPLDALARAYGVPYTRLDGWLPLAAQITAVLESPGPVVCEVPTPFDEPREPSQISERSPTGGMRSRPIEDLAPLLPRDEVAANLAVGP
ncbi:MAG TPA: thiamine pyrophosphate-binding protein, partial [Acidimicrobiales bacterium]|nr:thiamine pyrophosphate-binding protein [Acidimicrobiales bacterium]